MPLSEHTSEYTEKDKTKIVYVYIILYTYLSLYEYVYF
jgi:hypothetical protein